MTLTATEEIVVDEKGLIQGGFMFGFVDYTAMLASIICVDVFERHYLFSILEVIEYLFAFFCYLVAYP